MRTLTIEIPDNLADLLDTMPPDKRNNFAVSAMLEAADDIAEYTDEEPFLTPVRRADLPPAHVAAIEEGLADIDAGRVVSGEEALAHLRRVVGG